MDLATGGSWGRGTRYGPRRPLHRLGDDYDSESSVVVLAPPNSPEFETPPCQGPLSRPSHSTPLWQLDGLDNPALQVGPEEEEVTSPAADPDTCPEDTPPLPDSDPEEPIPVSFTYFNTIGLCKDSCCHFYLIFIKINFYFELSFCNV